MSSQKDKDYIHTNERGNGPKERMEGGDQTDDIDINDPETREKHLLGIKQQMKRSTPGQAKPK
jgi:hypothetical protein